MVIETGVDLTKVSNQLSEKGTRLPPHIPLAQAYLSCQYKGDLATPYIENKKIHTINLDNIPLWNIGRDQALLFTQTPSFFLLHPSAFNMSVDYQVAGVNSALISNEETRHIGKFLLAFQIAHAAMNNDRTKIGIINPATSYVEYPNIAQYQEHATRIIRANNHGIATGELDRLQKSIDTMPQLNEILNDIPELRGLMDIFVSRYAAIWAFALCDTLPGFKVSNKESDLIEQYILEQWDIREQAGRTYYKEGIFPEGEGFPQLYDHFATRVDAGMFGKYPYKGTLVHML